MRNRQVIGYGISVAALFLLLSTLLIAHNINPLLPYLNKVIYIANGKVATGTPKEVLTSARLSALFGTRVDVLRDSRGNIAVIGVEDYHGCQRQ